MRRANKDKDHWILEGLRLALSFESLQAVEHARALPVEYCNGFRAGQRRFAIDIGREIAVRSFGTIPGTSMVCRACGCRWKLHPDRTMSLYDGGQHPCALCDNAPNPPLDFEPAPPEPRRRKAARPTPQPGRRMKKRRREH